MKKLYENATSDATNPGVISDFVLAQACEMIKRHEGWRSHAYNDKDGIEFENHDLEDDGTVTIGFGFNVSVDGVGLPEDLADEWLKRIVLDLATFVDDELTVFDDFEDHVQIIVLDMVYNLGLAGFLKFEKTISFIVNEKYQEAAAEMLDSKWAKQVPKRAMELSKIMAGTDHDFLAKLLSDRVSHETDRKIENMKADIRQLVNINHQLSAENNDLRNQLEATQA